MSTIKIIDLGTPNDGNGDPLRTGGSDINDNFQALNTDKLETGGYMGTAQDLEDAINNVSVSGFVTLDTAQAITGTKTFNNIKVSGIITMGTSGIIDLSSGNIQLTDAGQIGLSANVTIDGTFMVFNKGILVSVL